MNANKVANADKVLYANKVANANKVASPNMEVYPMMGYVAVGMTFAGVATVKSSYRQPPRMQTS